MGPYCRIRHRASAWLNGKHHQPAAPPRRCKDCILLVKVVVTSADHLVMAVEGSERPEGWYVNPGPGRPRYFDGHAWTERAASADSGWIPKAGPSFTEPGEPNFVIERKTIYGNKMLYVSHPDGAKVGRINVDTGKVSMDQPELRVQFDRAVASWRPSEGEQHLAGPFADNGTEEQSSPSPCPTPKVLPKWDDLASNRPGQSARKKAIEIKKAAPVRTLFARARGAKTEERAWRIGADGEESVGKLLRRLDANWHVLHAVPVGQNGADIDHVVIGPPGVFSLNTKTHIGKNVWVAERAFMVNGTKTDYLRNSRSEAKRASKLLSGCGLPVTVHPIIVVIAAKLTVKAQPPDVSVVGRRGLVRWLVQQRPILTSQTVQKIYGHARMDTTWR